MNLDNALTRRIMRGRSIKSRLWTRKCHGCDDPSPHDAHLTWFGRRRFGAA